MLRTPGHIHVVILLATSGFVSLLSLVFGGQDRALKLKHNANRYRKPYE